MKIAIKQIKSELEMRIKDPLSKVKQVEHDFLKEYYKNNGTHEQLKRIYKDSVNRDLTEDQMVNMIAQTREIESFSEMKIKYKDSGSKKEIYARKKKDIQTALNEFEKKVGAYYEFVKNKRNDNINKKTLQKYKKQINKYKKILDKTTFSGLNTKDESLGLHTFIRELRRELLGNLHEFAVATVGYRSQDAISYKTEELIKESFKKGDIQLVGYEGQKIGNKKDYFTTDYIEKIGTMNVGVDVKSSSEFYIKSYRAGGDFFKFLKNSFGGQSSNHKSLKGFTGGDEQLMKEITYMIVNYRALLSYGIDASSVKREIFTVLEGVIMTSALINFIDFYLYTFENKARKQIILNMQKEIFFTSDMFELLLQLVKEYTPNNYSSIGWASIDTKAKNKMVPIGLMKGLWGDKREAMYDKKSKPENNTSFYNYLFSRTKTFHKEITSNVLSSQMSIRLQLPFNRL